MIYSIGYQKLNLSDLKRTVEEKSINFLVDCRSTPYGRRFEFNRKRLEAEFGIVYTWCGGSLGGFSPINPESIKWLAEATHCNFLLLCMEEDPRTCHRHYEIAVRLHGYGVTVTHLFRGEEITSTELEANK